MMVPSVSFATSITFADAWAFKLLTFSDIRSEVRFELGWLLAAPSAEADCNFVLTGDGGIIEIQATAEERPFSPEIFEELTQLAKGGVAKLVDLQKTLLNIK